MAWDEMQGPSEGGLPAAGVTIQGLSPQPLTLWFFSAFLPEGQWSVAPSWTHPDWWAGSLSHIQHKTTDFMEDEVCVTGQMNDGPPHTEPSLIQHRSFLLF